MEVLMRQGNILISMAMAIFALDVLPARYVHAESATLAEEHAVAAKEQADLARENAERAAREAAIAEKQAARAAGVPCWKLTQFRQ
jgi:hypothetical protein